MITEPRLKENPSRGKSPKLKKNNRLKPLNVIYVSSFFPRQCGIATFTRDLTEHINIRQPNNPARVMALCDALSEDLPYGEAVHAAIKQEDWPAYQEAIDFINSSADIDVVCLQHEYGIYGGHAGEFAAQFVEKLKKPVVATLHTILSEPTDTQREILQRICHKASSVVVMLEQGATVLSDTYQVPRSKIIVIPHGVPRFSVDNLESWKNDMGLSNQTIMCGINLISPSKGIEYGIKSLPEIVKHVPDFLYLVVGATHPVILARHQGRDEYREQLQSLSEELNVADHVRFINKYVSLDDLVKYVAISDFYLTPYIDPQQVTSGALSYAIGAGKVCISTPYLYAREMLNHDRGVLVPFRDHDAIANSVINLVKNPEEKLHIEQGALETGRSMNWEHVAEQYLQLFRTVLQ